MLAKSESVTPDPARREQAERERKQRIERERQQACEQAKRALEIWVASSPAPDDHPYLQKKQVSAHGAKILTADLQNGYTTFKAGDLVLGCAAYDADGKLSIRSLELINLEQKQGLHNAKRAGTFFPLDGSATLTNAPRIFVAEGFATAASVREATGDAAVCCFSAGQIPAVSTMLHTQFPNAQIVIAADNDVPDERGVRTGETYAQKSGFRYVIPPGEGADWNDYANAGGDVSAFIERAMTVLDGARDEPADLYDDIDPGMYENGDDYEPFDDEPIETQNGSGDTARANMPFRILGHYRGTRYYLPVATQQVVDLTAAQHTKNNLLALAPLAWWQSQMMDISTKDGLDMATNMLLQTSAMAGLFNGERMRGRGAWLDDGRAVVHMGEQMYVDGQVLRPEEIQSSYIYQNDIDLGVRMADPACNADANQLVQICRRLSWENDLSAMLLAGWCVIAPLTGILPWRPHIWVTGPSGSGKSTVLKSVIAVMMGDIALSVEGKTTEAGIRQQLGIDARPVLFDEAEAEDAQSIDRLKSILDFARVCSSGGTVVKGTATGTSLAFTARAVFCFSSINTSIKHLADESRISQLVLREDRYRPTGYYEQLERDIYGTITPAYADAMFSRSVLHMATLQSNCKTFVEAANIHFRSRRIADQVGVLLAGAYLCHSTKEITRDDALDWIRAQQWEDHTTVSSRKDCDRLLSRLMTHRLRVSTDRHMIDISVGEAVVIAGGLDPLNSHAGHKRECHEELRRLGMRIEGDRLLIANNSDPLSKMLAETPWASNWARPLSEFDGAEKLNTSYFSPGIKCRSISLPIELVKE